MLHELTIIGLRLAMRSRFARIPAAVLALAAVFFTADVASAWFDETHLAVAKAAGYRKWFNAAGADIARVKAGRREGCNHYSNHRPGETVAKAEVRDQIARYDRADRNGHLYGAIIASLRNAVAAARAGRYAHNHLAYCVHYIGDLSMPLHHTALNDFNKKTHLANDGIVNAEVLGNLHRIERYPIRIDSEDDLVAEIARIANLSLSLGRRLETEDRLMTEQEAYRQLGHSASLLAAVLAYFESRTKAGNPSNFQE
jgi:hypothetical protein